MKTGDVVQIIKKGNFHEERKLGNELAIYLETTPLANFYVVKLKLTGDEIQLNPECYRLEKVMKFKVGDFVRIVGVPFNTSNDLLGAVGELYYFDDTKFGITFASEIEGKNSHLLDIEQYTLLLVDKPLFGGIDFSKLEPFAGVGGLSIDTPGWRTIEPLADTNTSFVLTSGECSFRKKPAEVFKMSKLKPNYKLIKLQKL